MAGELPVDLRTQRKADGQDRWVPPEGEASATALGRRSPEARTPPGGSGCPPALGQRQTSRQPEGAPEESGSQLPAAGAILPALRSSTAGQPAGSEGEKKAEMRLPLRKRPHRVEEAPGPLAGKAPKREGRQGESGACGSHANGYCPPYSPVGYSRLPSVYYPGLPSPFLSSELPPLLHPVTPHPVLGIPARYSLLYPVEAQLAWDIAAATKQDEDGDTPLHIAVVQGNLPVVQRLVVLFHQGNRDLDTFNNLRQTPLHLAVITDQPALVKLLLSHGASPMVLDRNGQTALHLACEHGSLRCLQELLDGRPSLLDLEARNFEGFTPLHVAVGTCNREVVLTLLEHRADVDAVDIKSGRSPLLHAVENNNLPMVELLLQHGANVNTQSYGGNTALHAASGRGLLDMLRLLVRNGADGSLKNYHNDTPLMVAKNKRVIDILRGKASRPGPPHDNVYEGSSPANSSASSPGTRPAQTGLLCASPDSCPTTPSPAQTPKPYRTTQSPNSANQKPESIISTHEPSNPLYGVKPERSRTPTTSEQPMGFLGAPKYFLPVGESIMEPAFHPALYPFPASNHNHLPPHQFQLLPIGLNHSIVSLSPVSLANRIHSRGTGVDPPQVPMDLENVPMMDDERQWPPSNDSSPADS
ncbi:B-cell lymphoma 3 protein isoform X1 [Pogona vitticeps]